MRRFEPETTPCKWCGQPTTYLGTKECDPCHNGRNYLPYLLRSEKGRAYVRDALTGVEGDAMREDIRNALLIGQKYVCVEGTDEEIADVQRALAALGG